MIFRLCSFFTELLKILSIHDVDQESDREYNNLVNRLIELRDGRYKAG